jgi:hypothetical protein
LSEPKTNSTDYKSTILSYQTYDAKEFKKSENSLMKLAKQIGSFKSIVSIQFIYSIPLTQRGKESTPDEIVYLGLFT